MGLVYLYLLAMVIIVLLGSMGLAYRMMHPPRKTFGAALAGGLATEPAQLQMHGQPVTFKLRDGHTTEAWTLHGNDPHGPVVIITHGWGNSRYGALPKAKRLVPHASRVIVYDMRGHGDSSCPTCHLGASESNDLIDIMDQVEQSGDRFVLLGSSMGAGATMGAAYADHQHRPGRVVGIILDGPFRYAMQPVAGFLRKRRYPGEPFSSLSELWLRMALRNFGRYDRARQVAALTCPVMVLHGDEDRICPIRAGREIAQAAPHGWLVEFPGGKHGGLPLHDEPRYHAALRQFFTQLRDQP